MKTKILLLPILLSTLTFSLKGQTSGSTIDPCNCGSERDSVYAQLNSNEAVIVVRQQSGQKLVSESNMGKFRRSLECPDIFAAAPIATTPGIETPTTIANVEAEKKEIVRGKPFFLPDPVFYHINKSNIEDQEWGKIELAVDYLNTHPGSTVVVTGYADKKTGNTKTNLRLSEQRSNGVAKILEEKYGINKNRISVNWKGDGLQPFELDNDKNRAVLFLINP